MNRQRLKEIAEKLDMEIKFDSSNPGIHHKHENGTVTTKSFDDINKEFSISFKYSKISHIVWLIYEVEGSKVSHLEFIDKDGSWLDSHIDYYEHALSLKKKGGN